MGTFFKGFVWLLQVRSYSTVLNWRSVVLGLGTAVRKEDYGRVAVRRIMYDKIRENIYGRGKGNHSLCLYLED